MATAVIHFPGSNCDRDCIHALEHLGGEVVPVWHKDAALPDVDAVVLPGGFSYGDALRAGAIARFAPVMAAVKRFADAGGLVLGICNGFQILLESGLLEGAMRQNEGLHFACKQVHLRVENRDTALTRAIPAGKATLRIPIAHREGNYAATPEQLARLEANGQVLFRYALPDGALQAEPGVGEANPNGSMNHIAGIANAAFNVFGMMPHPERVAEPLLGGEDGAYLLQGLLAEAKARRAAREASR